MHHHIKNSEVLIVGAGPSGLMMACQLARNGIPFRIIDKKNQPTSYSRALILQARSLEIFDQMGIAGKALEQGIIARKINVSFRGKKPITLNLGNIGQSVTKFPYLLLLEQSRTEQLLIDFIKTYGYSVERHTELIYFTQDPNRVTVTLRLPDGSEEITEASWLIGADGSQSLVRKQLNIPFLGKTHELELFVLDSRADINLPNDEICFSFTADISSGIFPLSNGRKRLDGTIPKDLKARKSITFADIYNNYAKHASLDIKLHEPEWFSVFHSHQRYAEQFRKDRCFLIGDAAHVLSPVGAQGMNTGLQDAYNLAWKLSFVIRNKAEDSLLDSYQTERLRLAKHLIKSTDHAFHLVSGENWPARIFRLYTAPVLFRLLFPIIERYGLISRYLFKGISQTGLNYRNFFSSKFSFFSIPQPGDRLPYAIFNNGEVQINIQVKIRGTDFYLLIFAKQGLLDEFKLIAEKYKAILSVEVIPFNPGTEKLYKKMGIKKEGYYLVRPDMHIACCSNKLQTAHLERFLQQYLRT
ncbi:MAG TPA: FAD-dependent monooxygenase [Bacteroidales bacterium]